MVLFNAMNGSCQKIIKKKWERDDVYGSSMTFEVDIVDKWAIKDNYIHSQRPNLDAKYRKLIFGSFMIQVRQKVGYT